MTIAHSKQFKPLQKKAGKAGKAIEAMTKGAREFIQEFFKANKTICIGVIGALAIMAFVISLANIKGINDSKLGLKGLEADLTADTSSELASLQALFESGQQEIIQNEIDKHIAKYLANGDINNMFSEESINELSQSIYNTLVSNLTLERGADLTDAEKEAVNKLITDSINGIDYSKIMEEIQATAGDLDANHQKDVTSIRNQIMLGLQESAATAEESFKKLSADLDADREANELMNTKTNEKIDANKAVAEQMNTDTNSKIDSNKLATDTSISSLQAQIDSLSERLEAVFQLVSDGKARIGATLTELGVATVSDASFETIEGNIRTLAASKYNEGYNEGYTVGKAEGIAESQNAEIIYTYHDHEGSAVDGSGCFTEAVTHKHLASCYSTRKIVCGSTNWIGGYLDDPHVGRCAACGAYDSWAFGGAYTPACGNVVGYQTVTTCGMSDGQIIGHEPGCGYVDHQILRAEIIF